MSDDNADEYTPKEWEAAALAAGIPMSVIRGETKLSDHFSKEYIDHMANTESE